MSRILNKLQRFAQKRSSEHNYHEGDKLKAPTGKALTRVDQHENRAGQEVSQMYHRPLQGTLSLCKSPVSSII